ncbi:unnamed protein product [Clavelina lepadiformis]|uniref:rhomboid protease n=1 Tax=Clavelina lepadiformis TaxID=159417 RepID=A0ABP0GJD4_CLALP
MASMLLSLFTHQDFLHIYFTIQGLYVMSRSWENQASAHHGQLPKNLMSPEKFVAFYLSAGVVASFGSLLLKKMSNNFTSTVGGSGAVLGLFGYMSMKSPQSNIRIFAIPFTTVKGETAILISIAVDLVGLLGKLTNWRYLPKLQSLVKLYYMLGWRGRNVCHAAHLAGLLFGIWYAVYGEMLLYQWSNFVLQIWNLVCSGVFG